MKTLIYKSALSTALVAFGLVMHLGAASAAGSGDFNTNIAVTSAACHIKTDIDDESPFTATANFDGRDAPPMMNVSAGVRAVTVESNCPLTGITMEPSTADKFRGSAKAKDVAIASTSDGQWPMDFFYSNFEVYTIGNDMPDDVVNVKLGKGADTSTIQYAVDDVPQVAALTKRIFSTCSFCGKDVAGSDIEVTYTAPMYHYQISDIPTSFTSNPIFYGRTSGSNNGVVSVVELAKGDKYKFVAYIGAMFGVQPYGNDGLPMDKAVTDGEMVSLSRTLTVTAS